MGTTLRGLRKLVLADSEENECHDLHGDKNRIRPEQESEDNDCSVPEEYQPQQRTEASLPPEPIDHLIYASEPTFG